MRAARRGVPDGADKLVLDYVCRLGNAIPLLGIVGATRPMSLESLDLPGGLERAHP